VDGSGVAAPRKVLRQTPHVQAVVTCGAGFLLAVLWFDLMFDTQVRAHRGTADLPEAVLASIAAYYRRVTTAARPMNRLIAVVMLATLAALVAQAVRDDTPRWLTAVCLVGAAVPIVLAGARTVPKAVRLGGRGDTNAMQSTMAREIYAEHRFCFASITMLLVIQLVFA
jgi:hypothetical protein